MEEQKKSFAKEQEINFKESSQFEDPEKYADYLAEKISLLLINEKRLILPGDVYDVYIQVRKRLEDNLKRKSGKYYPDLSVELINNERMLFAFADAHGLIPTQESLDPNYVAKEDVYILTSAQKKRKRRKEAQRIANEAKNNMEFNNN